MAGNLRVVAEKTTEPPTPAPALRQPPPLPARLVDLRPLLVIGISLWFLAFCGFLVARLGFHTGSWVWLWTCFCGWVLGLIGLSVVYWQRGAARRGSRAAQQGAG
jgi:hypothetical protein